MSVFCFAQQAAGPEIFTFAEDMPKPVEGLKKVNEFILKNIQYPKQAVQLKVQGKVILGFVVSDKGELQNISVIKGIGGGCDEEAIRVLKLTKWNPGKQKGKPVHVRTNLPINFKL